MNIKEKIGKRIKEARLAKKMTRKVLASLTEDLNISRINNYERGHRTPGPQAITQLAKALDVSAPFLMGLTDEKRPHKIPGLGALIPLLAMSQVYNHKEIIKAISDEANHDNHQIAFIPISSQFVTKIGTHAFALQVADESMEPELIINDIIIIDPDAKPRPNGLVLAKFNDEDQVIIRRYKQLSTSNTLPAFELLPNNLNWAKVSVNENNQILILGNVKAIFRLLNNA